MTPARAARSLRDGRNKRKRQPVDYDDPTPAGVIRETWRWLPAWAVVLAVHTSPAKKAAK